MLCLVAQSWGTLRNPVGSAEPSRKCILCPALVESMCCGHSYGLLQRKHTGETSRGARRAGRGQERPASARSRPLTAGPPGSMGAEQETAGRGARQALACKLVLRVGYMVGGAHLVDLTCLVFSTSEGHMDTMWPRPLAPCPHDVALLHELLVAFMLNQGLS